MSDMQHILDDLAAGLIDSEEAARRIAVLQSETGSVDATGGPGAEPSDDDLAGQRPGTDNGFRGYAPPPPPKAFGAERRRSSGGRPGGAKGVERLEIRCSGRRVRVVGDSGVSMVSIDGPHVLRRNGPVLEITSEGSLAPSFDGIGLLRSRSVKEARDNAFGGKELVIRANPSLLVDVELSGGSLTTAGVAYLGQVRVTGGGATLEGVAECNDVLVQAGQALVAGTFRSGRSRVRVESGRGVVELGDDSNVTVRGESQLGRISWSGAHTGGGDEVVLGHGNARLDVEAILAYVTVKAGSTT